MNHKEYLCEKYKDISIGSNWSSPEEEWIHKLVLEIGVQPVIFKSIALTATYRLKSFSENGYAIGIGIVF